MTAVLIARRVAECAGMVSLFSFLEKSHSYYKFEVDDRHAQRLTKFRTNIAEETAELLEKLNQNLYAELEQIHRLSKSQDELSVWISKVQKDVPIKLTGIKKRNIDDQLRVIPIDQRDSSIRLSKFSERFSNNSEAALKHVLSEFYHLENEVIIALTTKQKQVSKVIESYRTKSFIKEPPRIYDAILGFTQMTACAMFSNFLRSQWAVPPAQLIVHEKKLPRFGKLLFGSLLVVAYALSEDEKEVNDYHLDTAYEAADLVMPKFLRLPPQQYSGITPVVFHPKQKTDDRFNSSYIQDRLGGAIIDGFIFRNILFGSLMMFSSSRTSHLLTAAAASVAASLQEGVVESYHEVRENEHSKAYVVDKALAHNMSFSIPLKPLLLQAMLFASGRWYLTVAVDMLMRLKEIKDEANWDDDLWVLFRPTDVYRLACRVVAFTDYVSSPLVRFVDKIRGAPSNHDIMSGKIIERYRSILQKESKFLENGTSKSSLDHLTTEDLVSLEKLMLFFSQTLHLPMNTLIPKPFNPSAPKRADPSGPADSQMLRNISGVDNDSLARVHAFLEDSERYYLNKYFNGKIDIKDAKLIVRQCITDKDWVGDSYESMEDNFLKRVMFWDTEATEENVLDLLQEFYEFILAKRILYAEDFLYVQGRAYMMDLECEPQISDDLMKDYYTQLDRWLLHAMELEEINFLNRYGLTKHHLQRITARRDSTKELSKTWEDYFDAKEYRGLIRNKADPVPVYRVMK